ncbi:MAG: GNAT family N-acetyltransferase [Deltaproteobacteria bacterium]|nr:GNAT family N-acetyltransferase [Deltaproteobacteria bacterium]
MNYFLDGQKIYLRALTKADVPIWYNWFNDPEVTGYMNKGIFPNTDEIQEAFYRSITASKNDIQLGVVIKDGEKLIGVVGIHNIDWIHRKGEVSVVIGDQKSWGQGFATEAISLIIRHAFTKMNLRRLVAGTWASNIASRRCFEKNGFILEGTLRESFFYKGTYVDEYRLGLLRSEWERVNMVDAYVIG